MPHLGVVTLGDDRSFVVADVRADRGGARRTRPRDRFLKHLERTKVLVHIGRCVRGVGPRPVEDFETVRRELTLFAPRSDRKPQLVVANKVDALDEPDRVARLKARADALSMPFYVIPGATGAGVDRLLEAAWERVSSASETSGSTSRQARHEADHNARASWAGTFDPIHLGHVEAADAARALVSTWSSSCRR